MENEYGEVLEQNATVEGAPAEGTAPAAPAEPSPPPAPAPPQPDPIQMMWMQQQQMQAQMNQMQQYIAWQAAQLQQRPNNQPAKPAEEPPDINTEPEKYVQWQIQQQFAPLQAQIRTITQEQEYNQVVARANELVMDPRFADYQQYYQTILQMAEKIPMAELAKPGSLELLYYTARGIHAGQAPAQAAQAAQAQMASPAAPQGHWPGAKTPPPPVAGTGSVGAGTAKPKTQLTAEQKEMARRAGMSEERYAKYL